MVDPDGDGDESGSVPLGVLLLLVGRLSDVFLIPACLPCCVAPSVLDPSDVPRLT